MLRRYLVPPLVACLCFLVGCKNKIETATPTVENITESVYASGRVKSRNQYSVFATVSSTLEEILVREGEQVTAGQPIARLKNNTAKLANDNAKIALRYAQLSENKEKLHEQRIAVQLAKEKLLTDSLLMVRQDNLRKQNIGSQVEWEQRKLAYESSAAAHHSASIRYHELERQLKLAANQAQISYEVATQQLGDFTVTSKINGKVYSWLKEQGELVNPQTAVAVIGDEKDFILELDIDESDIGLVASGQQVVVSLSSHPNAVWNATVSKIYPILNERTKLFTMEAEFTTTPPSLYPNLTAEANIIIRSKKNVLLIPRSYLINDSMVLIKSGEQRKVRTGLRDYRKVEIAEGLSANDEIVKPIK